MAKKRSREKKPLDEEQVASIIQGEIADAVGGLDDDGISDARTKALDYYYGREFGNEVEGRSSVVLTDVFDTVEWILPNLMRTFVGGKHVCRFAPEGPEDAAMAKQATDWVNHVFMRDNPGFMVLHDWFKDALIEKNGVVHWYWEEKEHRKIMRLRGLSQVERNALEEVEDLEILEEEELELDIISPDPSGPDVLPPIRGKEKRWNLKVAKIQKKPTICVENVAPEDFLISRRARSIDDAPFVGHRKRVTASDLLAMGYDADLIEDLPEDDSPEWDEEKFSRFRDEDPTPRQRNNIDPATREFWLTDCYVEIDEDGDGIAELRRIIVAGGEDGPVKVLEDYEVDEKPYAAITPIPMPHKFFGRSFAEVVEDLQEIRSTLLRQMLDNLYLTNNSRVAVVEGEVNVDDLLVSRPGGVVRMTAPGMVEPLPVQPIGPLAFNALEYLHGVRENRTGITRYNQGSDADTLNQTATGISKIMNAAAIRIEMIARIFAETGLKRLFQAMLRLSIEHADEIQGRIVRIENQYVPMNPDGWSETADVEVEVGLGTGQPDEKIQQLRMVLELQERFAKAGLAGFMVTPTNAYNAVQKIVEEMGFKEPNLFFTNPEGRQPPPPPPDPKIKQIEANIERDKAKLQLHAQKQQMDAANDQRKLQIEAQQAAVETQTEVQQAQVEARIEQTEAQLRLAIEREKAQQEMALARERMMLELELQREEMRGRLEIERERARAQARQEARSGAGEESNDAR